MKAFLHLRSLKRWKVVQTLSYAFKSPPAFRRVALGFSVPQDIHNPVEASSLHVSIELDSMRGLETLEYFFVAKSHVYF